MEFLLLVIKRHTTKTCEVQALNAVRMNIRYPALRVTVRAHCYRRGAAGVATIIAMIMMDMTDDCLIA